MPNHYQPFARLLSRLNFLTVLKFKGFIYTVLKCPSATINTNWVNVFVPGHLLCHGFCGFSLTYPEVSDFSLKNTSLPFGKEKDGVKNGMCFLFIYCLWTMSHDCLNEMSLWKWKANCDSSVWVLLHQLLEVCNSAPDGFLAPVTRLESSWFVIRIMRLLCHDAHFKYLVSRVSCGAVMLLEPKEQMWLWRAELLFCHMPLFLPLCVKFGLCVSAWLILWPWCVLNQQSFFPFPAWWLLNGAI